MSDVHIQRIETADGAIELYRFSADDPRAIPSVRIEITGQVEEGIADSAEVYLNHHQMRALAHLLLTQADEFEAALRACEAHTVTSDVERQIIAALTDPLPADPADPRQMMMEIVE